MAGKKGRSGTRPGSKKGKQAKYIGEGDRIGYLNDMNEMTTGFVLGVELSVSRPPYPKPADYVTVLTENGERYTFRTTNRKIKIIRKNGEN